LKEELLVDDQNPGDELGLEPLIREFREKGELLSQSLKDLVPIAKAVYAFQEAYPEDLEIRKTAEIIDAAVADAMRRHTRTVELRTKLEEELRRRGILPFPG